VIDSHVLQAIRDCIDLAPLHNPANIIGIEACMQEMPDTPMVAVFDTSFHRTMPEKAFLYGLPYKYYTEHSIRRYGAHGTSHDFVSARMAEMLGKDRKDMKIIVCHLGNGASISAVKNGECVDTSMGLTPLEGLVMGTRSGDLDPAIIQFIAKKENKTLEEVINILNKESGVYGISGISSDFRDLEEASNNGNKRAKIAMELFAYRVAKYIGAYTFAMNGVDAIAFSAGVGENLPIERRLISEYMEFLGVELDHEKNKVHGVETIITTPNSKIVMAVVPTNEELAIARDVVRLLEK
jgi:acetate kinase